LIRKLEKSKQSLPAAVLVRSTVDGDFEMQAIAAG
jgi:hypothetical protein